MGKLPKNVSEDVVGRGSKPAASYSVETLMFAMFDESFREYGQYYIPLLSHVIKKIFGDIVGYGWHLTSKANVEKLKSIQGTNKAISTLHKKDIPKVVSGGGVASGAEVAVLVKGNVLLKYDINAWTVVDEHGNRWVPVVSNKTGKAIGQDVEGLKVAYVNKLQELAGDLGLTDWSEVHAKWGKLSGESRQKLLTRFVKAMEEFVLEHAETIKGGIYDAIDVSEKAMDEVETGFNEIVISDFEIVKVVPVEVFREGRKLSSLMHTDEPIVERKSLDEKRKHIMEWAGEALEGLRSGNFIACDRLKMPFGTFFGAKVVGKYAHGLQNIYYFGMVDNPEQHGSATGRADLEDRKGTVWVKSYGVYDALEGSLRGIDGFQAHISKVEGFDAGSVIFAFSEGEKKVLYHELSHVYDLMVRGTRGVSGTDYRWSTRPEEIEAELNALYNAMLADDTLTLKDFEENLTPDHYGIGSADGRYDTMVGPLYGWAERHPEKVKIRHKKILRRWIEMRQMVMDKLASKKVESRKKFSDLMNEMPAWSDQDKAIASGIGKTHRMDIDARYKKKWKKIEDWRDGDYQYRVYASDSGKSLNLHVIYEYHEIAVFNWYKETRFWQTISAAVNINHQGKGIALKAYTHMIDKYMHTLSSDNTLTGETGKGSFDLWAKLGKIYPYKYIYNENNDKLTPVDGFNRDMMNYDNEHFVVSQYEI